MNGYQLTFFTQQDHKHDYMPPGEWLVQEARKPGVDGATQDVAAKGFEHDHKLHFAHSLELTDQPFEVTIAVSEQQAERAFAHLGQEGVKVFYIKMPIESGMTGES